MAFTMPPFSQFVWQDNVTPLDAANLSAEQQNIANFVQQVANGLDAYLENLIASLQIAFTPVSVVGTMGAVMGAAQPLTMSATQDTDLIGTLNADLTVTVTGFPAGSSARIMGSQDAVGGHALFITDGNTTLQMPIASAANKPFEVLVHSPDGFNIFLSVLGG